MSVIGVVGGGSFGTAIANLLAENNQVLLYFRRPEAAEQAKLTRKNAKQDLSPNIIPISDIETICGSCRLLFMLVPSSNFRSMLQAFSPYLSPKHFIIHGTKGLALNKEIDFLTEQYPSLYRSNVFTISEVIQQETSVKRIGILAGPNLSLELAQGQPAGCVIASRYDEVVKEGRKAIRSPRFQVFESSDVFGAEFSGVLKNVVAIAAGAIAGIGYGENAKAMLITRGLVEMIKIGEAFGSEKSAFLGLAGIGDLIATCSSPLSRNYTVGYRLAQGQRLNEILSSMEEVAEGVKTVKIVKALADTHKLSVPLTTTLYKILFEDLSVQTGMNLLMRFGVVEDVDFL